MRWQLRTEFDLYVLAFGGRRRGRFYDGQHYLVQFACFYAAYAVVVYLHGGFNGLEYTLFFQCRHEYYRNVGKRGYLLAYFFLEFP